MTTVTHRTPESKRAVAARVAAALRTETGLARLALGVAALHVVDDNFLQPEPGASAGDHLAGGLVQAAFFVLAAWAYPRFRPGARGTLAVLVGLSVAVMGAGEAGYYTRENGPSGDDYTGLLAIPAGVLLVGIGLVTLWRSRKGGSRVRRYVRRALLAAAFLLAVFLLVFPVASAYVYTHSARAYVPTPQLGALHGARRKPPGCSSSTATACCSSTGAARERVKGTPMPSVGPAPATCMPPSRTSRAGRKLTTSGSAGWACRSAAR
jgi:hypothetical protein